MCVTQLLQQPQLDDLYTVIKMGAALIIARAKRGAATAAAPAPTITRTNILRSIVAPLPDYG